MSILEELPEKYKDSALRRSYSKALLPSGIAGRFISVASYVTPELLGGIMARADQNDNRDLLTLAVEMEERDPHYFAVMQSLRTGIHSLTRDLNSVSDASDDLLATEECQEIADSPQFDRMLYHMTSAEFYGYAVSEIEWDYRLTSSGLRWVPYLFRNCDPRLFAFDPEQPQMLRIKIDSDKLPLPPGKFIVHTAPLRGDAFFRGGLARVCAGPYINKSYLTKFLMSLAEKYGMAWLYAIIQAGLNEDEQNKKVNEALNALTSFTQDGIGVFTEGNMIDALKSPGVAGNGAWYLQVMEYMNKLQSKAVLSQTMTTDDGSSRAQAQVMQDEFSWLKVGKGKSLAAAIRRDLFSAYVFKNELAGQPPVFRMYMPEQKNVADYVAATKNFFDYGGEMEDSVYADDMGFRLPDRKPGQPPIILKKAAEPAPQVMQPGFGQGVANV